MKYQTSVAALEGAALDVVRDLLPSSGGTVTGTVSADGVAAERSESSLNGPTPQIGAVSISAGAAAVRHHFAREPGCDVAGLLLP